MPANPYTSLTAGPSMLGREQQALVANPELIGLERQRKMAELLLAQGLKGQPEGQMISGYYVPPAWSQRLSPVLDRLMGQQQLKDVDEKTAKLAEALRKQEVADIERFTNLQRGTPAVAEQYTEMAGPFGEGVGSNNTNIPMPISYQPAQAAVAPDRLAALQFAAQSSSPALRAAGMKAFTEGPIKAGVDDVLLDPITFKPIFQGAGKLPTALDVAVSLIPNLPKNRAEWTSEQMAQVENKVRQLERDKASVTNINMPTEGERRAGFMANILDKNIAQMQTALGVDPSAVKPNVPASIVAAIAGPNVLSRAITPAQRQIIEDSQLDVLDAALTLRTGAAYTREQLLGMRDTYFPRIGDSPETVKAKQSRLETLLSSAYIAAGRATPPRLSETPPPAPARPTAQQLNVPKIGEAKAPKGVDQAVWNVMTPQEKALWK